MDGVRVGEPGDGFLLHEQHSASLARLRWIGGARRGGRPGGGVVFVAVYLRDWSRAGDGGAKSAGDELSAGGGSRDVQRHGVAGERDVSVVQAARDAFGLRGQLSSGGL